MTAHERCWPVACAENFSSFSSTSYRRKWARARCVLSVYRSTDCANRYAISESIHRLQQRRLAGHQVPNCSSRFRLCSSLWWLFGNRDDVAIRQTWWWCHFTLRLIHNSRMIPSGAPFNSSGRLAFLRLGILSYTSNIFRNDRKCIQ